MPQIHGTGTEDYYLACLWPNPNYNKPFAGCVGDITKIPGRPATTDSTLRGRSVLQRT